MLINRFVSRGAWIATWMLMLMVPVATGAQEIRPGLWEITTAMKMQGMALPGATFRHCFSARDLAEGKQHGMTDKDQSCTISNLKTSGAGYSYTMACTSPEGKMTGSARGTTTATSYETEVKLRMTPDEGMGEITQSIKGRLLGDCK